MSEKPVTVEMLASNQCTLDISYPDLGIKYQRSITIPKLRELGLTTDSTEYQQAYRETDKIMRCKKNRGKMRIIGFFVQLKKNILEIAD